MPQKVQNATLLDSPYTTGAISWTYENGELIGNLNFRLRPSDRAQVQDLRKRVASMAQQLAKERVAREDIAFSEAYREAQTAIWTKLRGALQSMTNGKTNGKGGQKP